MFRILFMHLQLRLRGRILKGKEKGGGGVGKHSTKQFLKFRDSQGSEGSIPNLACSPNPAKDLGISGLEGTLKATHSKLPPNPGIPSKASSTGGQPPHPPECLQRRQSDPLLVTALIILPDVGDWALSGGGGGTKQLSNNCSMWQTSYL